MVRVYFVIILFLLTFTGGLFFLVWPNTLLSQTNISFWPKPLVREFLEKKRDRVIKVVVDNQQIDLTYSDLGITLDVEKTMEKLEVKSLGELGKKWRGSLSRITFIQPNFEVGEGFEKLVTEKLAKKTAIEERFEFNQEGGFFNYSALSEGFEVDSVNLYSRLTNFEGVENKPIEIEKIKTSSDLKNKTKEINKKLMAVYKEPLELVIEEKNKQVKIKFEEMLKLLKVEVVNGLEKIEIGVNKQWLGQLLVANDLGDLSINWVSKKIQKEVMGRYSGGSTSPLVLGVDTGPNTDGSLANKYMEVDISQQKLFFFEDGDVAKEYLVSTGLYYPTPIGSYKIKNKSEMGFSGIFDVWMPWWMAFDYREDLGAYLGIHELPYKLIEGQKIYRFGNYIGSKKTGGCIALSPGDSREVYNKTYLGMDLVIYP